MSRMGPARPARDRREGTASMKKTIAVESEQCVGVEVVVMWKIVATVVFLDQDNDPALMPTFMTVPSDLSCSHSFYLLQNRHSQCSE